LKHFDFSTTGESSRL